LNNIRTVVVPDTIPVSSLAVVLVGVSIEDGVIGLDLKTGSVGTIDLESVGSSGSGSFVGG
jgi:hypothetical protein